MQQIQQLCVLLLDKLSHISQITCTQEPSTRLDAEPLLWRAVASAWLRRRNNLDVNIVIHHRWLYTQVLRRYAGEQMIGK